MIIYCDECGKPTDVRGNCRPCLDKMNARANTSVEPR